MISAAHLLLRAVARALAVDRRVLLVGDCFETLQDLAGAPVRELVVISSLVEVDTPAGQTASGAPLRMRPDWRERANSKDLVIDLDGQAPADEVARVLKKRGVYLSCVRGPALSAFAHVVEVQAQHGEVLLTGEGPATVFEPLPTTDEVMIYLAGADEVPIVPAVMAVRTAPPTYDPAQEALLMEQVDGLLAQAQTIEALEAQRDTLEAAAAQHTAALKAASVKLKAASVKTEATQCELDELGATYDEMRAELATRRVADRRVSLVEDRFEAARQALVNEVSTLRTRLLRIDEPADDRDQLQRERDQARAAFKQVSAALHLRLSELTTWPMAGDCGPMPQDTEALSTWIEAGAAAALTTTTAREVARGRLTDQLASEVAAAARARELAEAVETLTAERDEARRSARIRIPVTETLAEACARADALQVAVEAERAAAAAHRGALDRLRASVAPLQADEQAHRTALSEARREAARARLMRASTEDESARLRAELDLRVQHTRDLEQMIQAQHRMQSVLSTSLSAAEDAQVFAEDQRRLADENLAVLRHEMDRLQVCLPTSPARRGT